MLDLEQVGRYALAPSTQLLDQSSYNLRKIAQLRVLIVVVGKTDRRVFSQCGFGRDIFYNVGPKACIRTGKTRLS